MLWTVVALTEDARRACSQSILKRPTHDCVLRSLLDRSFGWWWARASPSLTETNLSKKNWSRCLQERARSRGESDLVRLPFRPSFLEAQICPHPHTLRSQGTASPSHVQAVCGVRSGREGGSGGAGNEILLEAGIQPLFMPPEKSQLCKNATQAITVDPIPRNIHPTHNEGRRKARAKAILAKIMRNETQVLFVDAARYWNRGAYAVSVVDAHGSLVNAATVVTNFTHEAEEMAIAVALQRCTGASIIYSDSRTAIRTFSAALVSSKAATVVNKLFYQERGEDNFPGAAALAQKPFRADTSVVVLGKKKAGARDSRVARRVRGRVRSRHNGEPPFPFSRLTAWLNCRAPCTSSEGRPCDIFGELPFWNEFFWPVGFQLRELSPGELSLVELHDGYCGLDMDEGVRAAMILIHLLTHHRCVVSLDLNDNIVFAHPTEDRPKLICDAFRKSPSLRKLKFRLRFFATSLWRSFAETLPHLIQLRDLELDYVPLDHRALEAFLEFLASTRSLTTLTMRKLFLSCAEAVLVIQGLKRNATITALSVNTSLLSSNSPHFGIMLTEYFRWNKTLRALSVTAFADLTSIDLRPVIEALFHNDTLSELNLTRLVLSELITDMLILNKTLRIFHMIECYYNPHVDTRLAFTNGSAVMSRWLVALAENKTLEELTLCLDWIDPDNYDSFFKALARNTSLKKVSVQNFRDEHVTEICRALRETGVEGRFVVGKHRVLKDTVVELPECKELSYITVECRHADFFEPLRTALCILPTCNHVKTLRLVIIRELFNSEVSSLIAQYITNTRALKELDLSFISGGLNVVDRTERTLVQALSLNNSIRKLSIRGLHFNDTESQVLVDMLDSSRTLYDLFLCSYDYKLTVSLTQKLSKNLSSNYTLLSVHLNWHQASSGELFTIEEVVRRNLSLVTRAAHFVMGTRHKYCVAAAELVHFNPGLVEKVQKLASIDEDEAASRIKNSLKSITELDDFMCLAGVVKHSVSCHRREDGQKQLVDLNRDCWLVLRQYLKVGDILDSK
ncbi:hypothetical protein HPB52_009196 [Rhipicephalus sanguineus]|uniref:Nlr family card domain protein n=1 Tax=Rhipicephalus sanguineus TaxID=34632 RepID=A0A9D4SQL2_RHISA|nr:hypothetical protein HPB52_009196 [Rhipicephalus sanguineus]